MIIKYYKSDEITENCKSNFCCLITTGNEEEIS